MKVSLKWLSEYFPSLEAKGGLAARSEELKERLALAGIEVATGEKLGAGIGDVIVAQIDSFEKHPDADRLNVCQVNNGKEVIQIVCGAPNVKAKMKVALAPVGSVLPGDFKIKPAKIRGVDSSGMLCSEKELGLSEAAKGIMELPAAAPVGSQLIKALGLSDEIWDVDLTPDRADCLSHYGVAREVGRLLEMNPLARTDEKPTVNDPNEVSTITVEVKEAKACPIYGAQLFENVNNSHSPEWLRHLLAALGQRSHEMVVDVTNYVLLDLGQPMHAFDADKITGSKIVVRYAKSGEKLKTLDGETLELHPEDLVIADAEKPMALAGVMGGLESSVTASTSRIVLETAIFDADCVRASAKRHRLHTDSSHRFERGVDASGRLKAAGRAIALLGQLTGAKRRGAYIEKVTAEAEKLVKNSFHNFDLRQFKNVVGIDVKVEEIKSAFTSLGILSEVKSPNVLRVEVPPYRHDLRREIDLVEEAARLVGYNRIPARYPVEREVPKSSTLALYDFLQKLRQRAAEEGLVEMMPYCFASENDLKHLPKSFRATEIENPLSQEWRYLRPNLSIGLINVLARHAALGQLRGSFFDLGSAFSDEVKNFEVKALTKDSSKNFVADEEKTISAIAESDIRYPRDVCESQHLALAMFGRRVAEEWYEDKKAPDRAADFDFFDAKGNLENLLGVLALRDPKWSGMKFVSLEEFRANADWMKELEKQAAWIPVDLLHPFRSAICVMPAKPPGTIKGFVGELHPALSPDLLNLPAGRQLRAVIAELCVLEDVMDAIEDSRRDNFFKQKIGGKIQASRKLPIVERDLALVFDAHTNVDDVLKTLGRAVAKNLLDIKCIDYYPLGDGRISVAFRVLLQGESETLSDVEIQSSVKLMIAAAAKKHQAELR